MSPSTRVAASLGLSVLRIGIVTVSDRASRGEYEDRSGPAIVAYLDAALEQPWEPEVRVVPDEFGEIEIVLETLCDEHCCDLVVTTGGTGLTHRDITPEVTEAVCSKLLPGLGEAMRIASLTSVPTAILSRQTAGVRGESLIVNLPGSPKAIAECLNSVWPAIVHGIHLLRGDEPVHDVPDRS